MIKILHLADLHIGMENYGKIDPATGLHSRLLDYLRCFDEAIEIGMREEVDLVLIAGDIYKNRTPNPTHQREFAKRIRRICAAGIPVFIITGNHDISPALGRAHAVEIFATLDIEGVTIADRPKLHWIETRKGEVQIIALPWISRQSLLTKEELKQASLNEIESELRKRVDRFIEQSAAELDPNVPAVLAFHGSIDGAVLGAERSITLGQDMVLARSIVAQAGIDYVALGHIHKHQSLGEHPPIVYPGSIERIDFGEAKDDKGCVIVELERGNARWQFHPLDARPFVSIEHDLRSSSDPLGLVRTLIAHQNLARAVVRVELQASREQVVALREDEIRRMLEEAGAFHVANVTLNVERPSRRRFAGAEQALMDGLTPRKALEIFLRQKQPALAPARIEALLAAFDELQQEA